MIGLEIEGGGIPLSRRTPRFSAKVLREALKVVTKHGYGYKDELFRILKEELKDLETDEDVKNLIRVLEVLGYISNGFVRDGQNYRSTWKATDKAYKEVYPYWRYLVKTLFGK